jgi:two-component system chemotaxis response regulator CheB
VADEERPDIVVAGASAGGVEAMQKLVSTLPADLDAVVLLVVHLPAEGESYLPQILTRAGKLPVAHPAQGQLLEVGRIYAAPPDRHVLIYDSRIRVVRGPRENRHRPSIDVLFRSAASAYGARVIGVLLTGSDDDGAAGLKAIQERGGIAVVQDPADSQYPQMPESALRVLQPDYKCRLDEIGPLVRDLVAGVVKPNGRRPVTEPVDQSYGQEQGLPIDVKMLGTPSAFTCPDCNGALWELQDGKLLRYRCRVGHAFSQQSMLEAQSDTVERALWEAVRTLEESAAMSRRIARNTQSLRSRLIQQAGLREEHARVIRELLLHSKNEELDSAA